MSELLTLALANDWSCCLDSKYLLIPGLSYTSIVCPRQWGTGGTNPIRGADTQLGDDGDVDRAMGNAMPCEWRIWNDGVVLSGRKWRHIHCFSPSCASAPPFALSFHAGSSLGVYQSILMHKINSATKMYCYVGWNPLKLHASRLSNRVQGDKIRGIHIELSELVGQLVAHLQRYQLHLIPIGGDTGPRRTSPQWTISVIYIRVQCHQPVMWVSFLGQPTIWTRQILLGFYP
jgi:hypothetical protein